MKDFPSPVNFPKEWLPAVWGAIQRQEVKWGKDSLIGGAGLTEFEWASAHWNYEEIFERPMSITLISGTPDAEDLTVAVLKGKIETS
jgi:hypothetical protein